MAEMTDSPLPKILAGFTVIALASLFVKPDILLPKKKDKAR
jgi:hypothetical protein